MKGLQPMLGPSKLLDSRWKREQHIMHKKKIRQVKSTIRQQYQSQPFGTQMNLRNGKKEALMECKCQTTRIRNVSMDANC